MYTRFLFLTDIYWGISHFLNADIHWGYQNDATADLAFGRTALHWAAYGGHLPICTLLLDNGADINATDRVGFLGGYFIDGRLSCRYDRIYDTMT